MRTFDISIAEDTVSVKPGKEAVLAFTVTNVSGQDLRALVKLVPEKDEYMAWLETEGEGRREVESAQSDTVVVKIKPPQGAPPGAGRFRLVVASEENPDEDFADAVVQFTVEPGPAPEPRPRRWWPIAAAAGVVVVVVLLAALRGPEPVRPQPVQPKPVQPKPVEPKPVQPKPVPPKPVEEVYAITDVMVTDDATRVPGDYTGVSKRKLTLPYIAGQVGERVEGSDVNEGIRGKTTTIWVKYERLPVDSGKEVLVDIKVCSWPDWTEKLPKALPGQPRWTVASGTSGIRAGGLTTGGAKADPCGLAVQYQPLSKASERILALSLSRTSGAAPTHADRSKFPDWVGLKGKNAPWEQAGIDIQTGANRGTASGHPFVYLIRYPVAVPRPETRSDPG